MKETIILIAQAIVDPSKVNIPKADAGSDQVQIILQIVFALAGVIAVIVVIVAGMSYVLSNGDPGRAAKAKDSILYAVIGLAIAILSFTIVTFVIGRIF